MESARVRVLVLLAHPALHRSRANARLTQAARAVPGVTVHDLYQAYPDLHLDRDREQELLLAHDVIVWQHPFYWYSTPSILKEWQDIVLSFRWAYGPGGERLHGKAMLHAITTGGPEAAYQHHGSHGVTMHELLAPQRATARLCGMPWWPPFVVHAAVRLDEAQLAAHAADYARLLGAIVSGELRAERLVGLDRINHDLNALLG